MCNNHLTIALSKNRHIAVIGGGPAGLMAAETAVSHGANVTLYDAMPSVGRKFLVAGKSGLNLTFDEDIDSFISRYTGPNLPDNLWSQIIRNFDNTAMRKWAMGLGVETFTASSGKVFPCPNNGVIRAAPLLRRWITRLKQDGVTFKCRHRWLDIDRENQVILEHDGKKISTHHDAVILALGGASWPETGSNGKWVTLLHQLGVEISPLTPANCGWEVSWPDSVLAECEGAPLKNASISAANHTCRGELVITRYGLEGGPIYRLGPQLRAMAEPQISIDFKPDLTADQLLERMRPVKRNYIREAKRRCKLDPAACSLLKHLPHIGPWKSTEQVVKAIKNCPLHLLGPRPLDESISSAGGVTWQELDSSLMLRKMPHVYVVGEMLDWEAPTGGYLMQASFATGKWAGMHAANPDLTTAQ